MKGLLLAILLTAGAVHAAEPVKFGDALQQTFHHPRCLQCHQFNSARHQGRAYHSHRARYLCDKCHTANITGLPRGEWIAPPERMDWTGLNARDTCLLAKQNLGEDDPESKLLEHLLSDVRVRWALDNGMTPGGRFPAVPGGYPAFARQLRAWVESGMDCD